MSAIISTLSIWYSSSGDEALRWTACESLKERPANGECQRELGPSICNKTALYKSKSVYSHANKAQKCEQQKYVDCIAFSCAPQMQVPHLNGHAVC